MARAKPTVPEIVALYWELKTYYQNWHSQQVEDDRFYNLLYKVAVPDMPNAFEQVRPPSASSIVDLVADHASGNFPLLHVPRRKETDDAQKQSTLMEHAGRGFWYRNLAGAPRNHLRAWAQSGALRGAIGAKLLYNPDAWPDLPLPSKNGGIDSETYKAAKDEAIAKRKSAWPFVLDYIDPLDMYPDPATEGKDFIIHAFSRMAFEVKRAWPQWDYRVPGDSGEPLKPTDKVEFIHYSDDTYSAYIVAGMIPKSQGTALNKVSDGVQKHGYGFPQMFFTSGGFGSPFGLPEHRYSGILTKVVDLFKLEARRFTHIDAVIGQQAFPWIIAQHGVNLDMSLMGVTRVPTGTKPSDAVAELRPTIPIQELVQELAAVRSAIQRATIPDALGAEPSKSDESGYLRSLKIGTGRAKIRALTDSEERAVEWATNGFFKLIDNKKLTVSVWGKGMDDSREFVTIGPDDIKGFYEVYASIAPSLPNDESADIANGGKLFEHGLIPGRDYLETYAHRENAEELMLERLGEDVLKSPPMMQQLVAQAMATTSTTGGAIAVPGFAAGQVGIGGVMPPPGPVDANPQSMAGVGAPRQIPTPPNPGLSLPGLRSAGPTQGVPGGR